MFLKHFYNKNSILISLPKILKINNPSLKYDYIMQILNLYIKIKFIININQSMNQESQKISSANPSHKAHEQNFFLLFPPNRLA
jgi:hypothetical protein